VRQLENTCRWLTVMASGREILVSDLPPELRQTGNEPDSARPAQNWEQALSDWARRELLAGATPLLDTALPAFEKIMITSALNHTGGRRRDAAELLGWGRNTLTRKIKELKMDVGGDEDDEE
jgi:two-component system nitrogen regulation response regulator GlnG